MAGNTKGGLKAAQTIKERHGDDFYSRIGGLNVQSWRRNGCKPRGFAWMKANGQEEKIREAGRKGGTLSRRSTFNDK